MKRTLLITILALLFVGCKADLIGNNRNTHQFEKYDIGNNTVEIIGSSSVTLDYLTKQTDSLYIGLTQYGDIFEYNYAGGVLSETFTGNSIKMNGSLQSVNNRMSKFYEGFDIYEGVVSPMDYFGSVSLGSLEYGVTSSGLFVDGVHSGDWGCHISGLSVVPEVGVGVLMLIGCAVVLIACRIYRFYI